MLPSMEQLAKRRTIQHRYQRDDITCVFCFQEDETLAHFLFQCPKSEKVGKI